jgi:excisionase family DNA binding protein
MSQLSTGLSREEKQAPLAVPPLEAARMLSLGLTRLYRLMRSGELDSFHSGRSRRITVRSIEAYVARQLDAATRSRKRQRASSG